MPKFLAFRCATAVGALSLLPSAAVASPLLPDLMIESRDAHVVTMNGQKLLRFTTWAANRGVGPIELRGGQVNGALQDVDQRVYDSDGVSFSDQRVGTFVYHPEHGHIHFQDYADYYLREVNADDSAGSALGSSEKVSFCLLDSQKASPPHPGTPPNRFYVQCDEFQGISVGWVDVYDFTLPGQNINLTGISSGTYWLEMVVDRANRLLEANESNNSSRVKVAVTTGLAPEINLIGNTQPIANNDTTPSDLDHTDFGDAAIGSGSITRTFSIQNAGTGTLSLTGMPRVEVMGSGDDFAVIAQPTSPVPASGGATTFQVVFTPREAGTQNATVRIFNNDSNESTYEFAIQGSVLQVRNLERDEAGWRFSFDSIPGRNYRVEYKDALSDSGWTLLEDHAGGSGVINVIDSTARRQRFYRVTASP